VTEFAVGFHIAGDVVVMIAVQMIQIQTILKPNPSITGNRAHPTQMSIVILTESFLVLHYSRASDTFLASSSTSGTFRLERPIFPLPNLYGIVASFVDTCRESVTLREELVFHLTGDFVKVFSHN
jgi:hypothetical protein